MPHIVKNYKITKETEKSILLNDIVWLPKSQINIYEEIKEIELTKFVWQQKIVQFYRYIKDDTVDMREFDEIKELSTLPITKTESIIIKTGDGVSVTAISKNDIPSEYYGEREFSSTWAKSDLKILETYNHNYMLMHFGFYDGFRCYDLGKINVLPNGKVYYPAYNKLKATCFEQEKYNIYYPKELVELLIEKNNITKVLNL